MKQDIIDILIQLFNAAIVVAIIGAVIGGIIFFATLFLLGRVLWNFWLLLSMELPKETINTAIFAHLITIIPAFLLAWQAGVFMIIFWLIWDLLYYFIMKL